MNKDRDSQKLILSFNLACEEGNIQDLRTALHRCRDFGIKKLELISQRKDDKALIMIKKYVVQRKEMYYPLHIAVRNGHSEVVKYLVENGFNVSLENNSGQTPIFEAAFFGYDGIIKYLIKSKANVNVADHRGWTPLMVAVNNNHTKSVKILLDDGQANLKMVDKYGKRAIDKAKNLDMVELLRSVDSERVILKAYGEPEVELQSSLPRSLSRQRQGGSKDHTSHKKSQERDQYKKEKIALNDLINMEMDNMGKRHFKDITSKIREKFADHLRAMGIRSSEAAFKNTVGELDHKMKVTENLLFQEAQKNYNTKYKKFVKEMEKYLNLKLNIMLQSYFPADGNNTNNTYADLPVEEQQLNTIQLTTEDYIETVSAMSARGKSTEKNAPSTTKQSFVTQIAPPQVSKKRNISISTPNHKGSNQGNIINFSSPQYEPSNALRSSQEDREIHNLYKLPDNNTRPLTSRARTSKSPARQGLNRAGSESNIKAQGKQPVSAASGSGGNTSTVDNLQFLVKQADRIIESVNSSNQYILESIIDRKLDAIRININEQLHKLFKKSVVELKEKIELKIEDVIYNAAQQQQQNIDRLDSLRQHRKSNPDTRVTAKTQLAKGQHARRSSQHSLSKKNPNISGNVNINQYLNNIATESNLDDDPVQDIGSPDQYNENPMNKLQVKREEFIRNKMKKMKDPTLNNLSPVAQPQMFQTPTHIKSASMVGIGGGSRTSNEPKSSIGNSSAQQHQQQQYKHGVNSSAGYDPSIQGALSDRDRRVMVTDATSDSSRKNEYLVKKLEDLKKINKNLANQAERMNQDLALKLSPQPKIQYDENYPQAGQFNQRVHFTEMKQQQQQLKGGKDMTLAGLDKKSSSTTTFQQAPNNSRVASNGALRSNSGERKNEHFTTAQFGGGPLYDQEQHQFQSPQQRQQHLNSDQQALQQAIPNPRQVPKQGGQFYLPLAARNQQQKQQQQQQGGLSSGSNPKSARGQTSNSARGQNQQDLSHKSSSSQKQMQYPTQSQGNSVNNSNNVMINENPGFLVEPERIYYSNKEFMSQQRTQEEKESDPTIETDRARQELFQNEERDNSLEISKSNHDDQEILDSIPVEKEIQIQNINQALSNSLYSSN